jgi:putative hemolysin
LDITSITGTVVLALAALLLIVISGAEAGIIALTRSRVRSNSSNGVAALLDNYIIQRHQLLRVLGVASTTTIVAATSAATLLALQGETVSGIGVATVGIATALITTLLRQSARTLVLLSPERASTRLARPIRALRFVFSPLGWLAALPVSMLLRASGQSTAAAKTDPADELMALIDPPDDAVTASELVEERRMMRGIMAMSDQTVRELMTSRMDLVSISTDASLGDVMNLVIESGFTRIPLYEESVDQVIGVLYAKDLLAYMQADDIQPELREVARPPYFIPEAKRANALLADLKRDQIHMAIAVDEYGGTAGVVTVEDLIEEIVGEIVDEYDTDEIELQRVSDDVAIVDARFTLDDLNELFGLNVESEDFDTVGGLVFSLLGRLAAPGDNTESEQHGLKLRVLSVLGRRIKRVRVERVPIAADAEPTEAAS